MTTTSRIMASLAFAAVCGFAVQSTDAGWRHGSFGSSGSSESWGSSGSSGSYGSGGSFGSSSSGVWRRAMRAERRAYRHSSSGSHGSSGHHSSGSYGSHGSSGSSGYSGSSGSSGSAGSAGSYGGGSYYGAQQAPANTARHIANAGRPFPKAPATPSRLRLEVPADALVYLSGQKMNQTGTRRSYRLPDLPAGQLYDYPVVVQVVRQGRTVSARFSEPMSAGVTKEVHVAEQSGQLVVRREGADDLLAQSR